MNRLAANHAGLLGLVVLVSLTLGCDTRSIVAPKPAVPSEGWPTDSSYSDSLIRAVAYSSYQAPEGFYHEDQPGGIAPYYVNTVSVKPLCCRPADWRELSTEDAFQAWSWAESTVAYSNGVAPLDPGAPIVTQRYFEFRPLAGASGTRVPMRAHRLSYIDRSMVDFFHRDSVLGVFGVRPVDTTSVRGLAEYLWFKERGFKALSSFGRDLGGIVVHTIYEVGITYGDWGMCDEIELYRLEYRVSKASGLIILRRVVVRQTTGRCH